MNDDSWVWKADVEGVQVSLSCHPWGRGKASRATTQLCHISTTEVLDATESNRRTGKRQNILQMEVYTLELHTLFVIKNKILKTSEN